MCGRAQVKPKKLFSGCVLYVNVKTLTILGKVKTISAKFTSFSSLSQLFVRCSPARVRLERENFLIKSWAIEFRKSGGGGRWRREDACLPRSSSSQKSVITRPSPRIQLKTTLLQSPPCFCHEIKPVVSVGHLVNSREEGREHLLRGKRVPECATIGWAKFVSRFFSFWVSPKIIFPIFGCSDFKFKKEPWSKTFFCKEALGPRMWKRIGGGGGRLLNSFFFFQLKNVYWPPFLSFLQFLEREKEVFSVYSSRCDTFNPSPPFAAVMTHGTDGERIHQKSQRNFHLEAMFLQAGTNTVHAIFYVRDILARWYRNICSGENVVELCTLLREEEKGSWQKKEGATTPGKCHFSLSIFLSPETLFAP